MTLTYELDIDIPKVHLHTKMNFLGQALKSITDSGIIEYCRQTDVNHAT